MEQVSIIIKKTLTNQHGIRTSVRAQLQLIAVHKNMFIKSMIRNKMPNVMHNQSSHDGRIPPSSHAGDITTIKKKMIA